VGAVTPYWVAGKPATSDQIVEVTHPFNGRIVRSVSQATDADVERAVAAAHAGRPRSLEPGGAMMK
jgi:acyl-CoA reductase-like NAD-dependent aldehyde dehydrogenase